MVIAFTRTSGFQCRPPMRRVNSPKRPSGWVQPVGRISASSTISESARQGRSIVSHWAKRTASPRMPPAIAISSTPSGARKPEPMISNGWQPIEIEIGSGSPRSSARAANRRMLFGVTMSMPVRFFSFTMNR